MPENTQRTFDIGQAAGCLTPEAIEIIQEIISMDAGNLLNIQLSVFRDEDRGPGSPLQSAVAVEVAVSWTHEDGEDSEVALSGHLIGKDEDTWIEQLRSIRDKIREEAPNA